MLMRRSTRQRQAVREVFEEGDRPLGTLEILDAARKYVPQIGIATIYRTVNLFLEEGYLVPVEIPGEPPRYELSGKGHHHHFFCRMCRKLFVIEQCRGDFHELTPPGFVLEEHILILSGKCVDCRGKKPIL